MGGTGRALIGGRDGRRQFTSGEKMRKIMTATVGALLAVAATGCDQPVSPGEAGSSEMRVGVRGDEPPAGTTSGSSASRSAEASGRIDVTARVYLWSEAKGWVELTRGAARQTVEASGSDGLRALASARVDAGSYRRVRVDFDRVEGSVIASAGIDAGLLTGSVRVDGGSDGRVSVEREVRFDARGGAASELEIDLNADQWYDASAGARTVGEAEFRGAVRIVAR
jgi:hypothetical protein